MNISQMLEGFKRYKNLMTQVPLVINSDHLEVIRFAVRVNRYCYPVSNNQNGTITPAMLQEINDTYHLIINYLTLAKKNNPDLVTQV